MFFERMWIGKNFLKFAAITVLVMVSIHSSLFGNLEVFGAGDTPEIVIPFSLGVTELNNTIGQSYTNITDFNRGSNGELFIIRKKIGSQRIFNVYQIDQYGAERLIGNEDFLGSTNLDGVDDAQIAVDSSGTVAVTLYYNTVNDHFVDTYTNSNGNWNLERSFDGDFDFEHLDIEYDSNDNLILAYEVWDSSRGAFGASSDIRTRLYDFSDETGFNDRFLSTINDNPDVFDMDLVVDDDGGFFVSTYYRDNSFFKEVHAYTDPGFSSFSLSNGNAVLNEIDPVSITPAPGGTAYAVDDDSLSGEVSLYYYDGSNWSVFASNVVNDTTNVSDLDLWFWNGDLYLLYSSLDSQFANILRFDGSSVVETIPISTGGTEVDYTNVQDYGVEIVSNDARYLLGEIISVNVPVGETEVITLTGVDGDSEPTEWSVEEAGDWENMMIDSSGSVQIVDNTVRDTNGDGQYVGIVRFSDTSSPVLSDTKIVSANTTNSFNAGPTINGIGQAQWQETTLNEILPLSNIEVEEPRSILSTTGENIVIAGENQELKFYSLDEVNNEWNRVNSTVSITPGNIDLGIVYYSPTQVYTIGTEGGGRGGGGTPTLYEWNILTGSRTQYTINGITDSFDINADYLAYDESAGLLYFSTFNIYQWDQSTNTWSVYESGYADFLEFATTHHHGPDSYVSLCTTTPNECTIYGINDNGYEVLAGGLTPTTDYSVDSVVYDELTDQILVVESEVDGIEASRIVHLFDGFTWSQLGDVFEDTWQLSVGFVQSGRVVATQNPRTPNQSLGTLTPIPFLWDGQQWRDINSFEFYSFSTNTVIIPDQNTIRVATEDIEFDGRRLPQNIGRIKFLEYPYTIIDVETPENRTTIDSLDIVPASSSNSVLTLLTGGDSGLFETTPQGQIKFINNPDFETPLDANGDNIYEVLVTVSEDNNALEDTNVSINIEVADVDESPTGDSDADNVANGLEDAGPNSGDANGDGLADSNQSDVASFVYGDDYVVLDTNGDPGNLCNLSGFEILSENQLPTEDPDFDYSSGLVSIDASCSTVTATVYIYDNGFGDLRGISGGVFGDLHIQNERTVTIGGQSVTAFDISLLDNGLFDTDGSANDSISFIFGFGTAVDDDDDGGINGIDGLIRTGGV